MSEQKEGEEVTSVKTETENKGDKTKENELTSTQVEIERNMHNENEFIRIEVNSKIVKEIETEAKADQKYGNKSINQTCVTMDEDIDEIVLTDIESDVKEKIADESSNQLQDNAPPPDQNYVYQNRPGYGQTPYYQQQVVAGQPVYIMGAPPPTPVDASRMPSHRSGQNEPSYYDDISISTHFGSSFNDRNTRHRFVQKVYTILSVQLLYTAFFISLCIFVPPIKYFVIHSSAMFLLAGMLEIILYMVLICCEGSRRNYPMNFILLGLFTVSFAYIMGVISALNSTLIVLSSMGITAIVCTLISILANQTSYDITSCGIFLCIASMIVMVFGFIAIIVTIFTRTKIMFLIYAGLIALLFSMYLMYDTQQIMGGRRIQLSEEEYICGALCLYVDIMEIFWAILTICGYSDF